MSALTASLFSLNLVIIIGTEYSADPFNRIEFNDADSFELLEESQHMQILVEQEDSFHATVVGMKCFNPLFRPSCTSFGRSFNLLMKPSSCSFFISFLTCSKSAGSLWSLLTISLFCALAVAQLLFTLLTSKGLRGTREESRIPVHSRCKLYHLIHD